MAGMRPPPYVPPGQVLLTRESPASTYGESQQPSAFSQPPVSALPVKSFSSVTITMAELRVQARESVIVSTALFTNASAFALSAASLASSLVLPYGHGV